MRQPGGGRGWGRGQKTFKTTNKSNVHSLQYPLFKQPVKISNIPVQIQKTTPWCDLTNNFFKTECGDLLTKSGGSERFQPAVYIVFHEESESEVQNTKILQENLNTAISNCQNKYF